jgi:hypothetical protein
MLFVENYGGSLSFVCRKNTGSRGRTDRPDDGKILLELANAAVEPPGNEAFGGSYTSGAFRKNIESH